LRIVTSSREHQFLTELNRTSIGIRRPVAHLSVVHWIAAHLGHSFRSRRKKRTRARLIVVPQQIGGGDLHAHAIFGQSQCLRLVDDLIE
jgi:hypothetical protein